MRKMNYLFGFLSLLVFSLWAQEPAKRFSVAVSAGLKGNLADLGGTITKDGTIDTGSHTLAKQVYSTSKVIMSDRDNFAIKHNSASTGSAFNLLKDTKAGNPLTGLDLGINTQYDLDDILGGIPLFTRVGFQYMLHISGGSMSRTLGDATVQNTVLGALLLTQTGKPGSEYAGGTMKTEFSAGWMEIPVSIGFNARLNNNQTKLYAGVGASWFYGGWDVKLDIDEKYANVLGTSVNLSAGTATNYWAQAGGGSLSETVKFRASGLSVHYFTGLEQMLAGDLAAFIEVYASGYVQTVYSSELSDKAQKLLTMTSSDSLYNYDSNWFKRLAFPVVLGGASIKVGARYFLF